MAFDLDTWKTQFVTGLKGWKPRMQRTGVDSIYAFLSAAALWPVVEAARAGDWSALAALGGVLAGVGTNLLANQVQGWKDEAEAACQLEEAVPQQPELRAELDAVLAKLDALQAAEGDLPQAERTDFTRLLSQELEKLGSRLKIEIVTVRDGAYVKGEGAIGVGAGGMVIGGNVGGNVVGPGGTLLTAPDPRQLEAERVEQARRLYLQHLRQACQVLPLATLGGEEGGEEDVTLDRVYIALDTTTRVKLTKAEKKKREKEDRLRRLEPDDTRPLSALEVAKAHPRVALLGDPGAGKSTFLRNLLACQAAVQLGEVQPPLEIPGDLLPVLIILRDLVPRLARLDLEALPQRQQRQALIQVVQEQIQEDLRLLEAQEYSEKLFERLQSGKCLLALDGLDEVPASLRSLIRLVVAALLEKYRIQRILLTCRTRSYTGEAVLPGFDKHTLAPFDEDKVRDFATGWYQAQKELRRVNPEQARDKAQDLAQAALGADLREISSNPMMLTAMAIIHQKEIGLPRERVRLYNLVVDVLLRRWQKQKTGERELAPSPELVNFLKDDLRLRAAMERLAYEAHRSRLGEAEAADLPRGAALTLLEAPQYLGQTELAAEFLDYVDQRAGLLLGRGGEPGRPQTYAFPHRTFQEYLAGCYLAGQRDLAREFYTRAGEGSDWSLAAQLGLEELQYNRRNTNALLDLAYQLGVEAEGEQSQRSVLWAGNIAVLVGSEAILHDAASPQGGPAFLERLKSQLVRLLGGALSAPERAEAGRILGRLGDPRPEVNSLEDMLFCWVPDGLFRMEAEEKETKIFEVDLEGFFMARLPVTNAHFQAFVAAGGYYESRYWTEALKVGTWEDGSVIRTVYSIDEERKLKITKERASEPHQFGDPFYLPNHPVVGVTWFETLAFTRWLTERWHALGLLASDWEVHLPSEAEWEKAARGGLEFASEVVIQPVKNEFKLIPGKSLQWIQNPAPDRDYPWGDQADPEKANYAETGIGSTSAVGCFPKGASPYGVLDLSGNVWEWTRSLYEDYPYPEQGPARAARESLKAPGDIPRVLRGGSFDFNHGGVRCAYRLRLNPDFRLDYLGFRVVVSPFDSGL